VQPPQQLLLLQRAQHCGSNHYASNNQSSNHSNLSYCLRCLPRGAAIAARTFTITATALGAAAAEAFAAVCDFGAAAAGAILAAVCAFGAAAAGAIAAVCAFWAAAAHAKLVTRTTKTKIFIQETGQNARSASSHPSSHPNYLQLQDKMPRALQLTCVQSILFFCTV
jgi:hypothetical protein